MRPVQYFSDEYLNQCRNFSVSQIIEFVEGFRKLFAEEENRNKLIEQEKAFLEYKIVLARMNSD